jgi:hypothetical protein
MPPALDRAWLRSHAKHRDAGDKPRGRGDASDHLGTGDAVPVQQEQFFSLVDYENGTFAISGGISSIHSV